MSDSFCPKCGAACQLGDQFCKSCGCNLGGAPVGTAQTAAPVTPVTAGDVSEKSPVAALFLCMYLGWFGVHRFYAGKIGTGILMLCTLGGLGLWVLIDLFTIACSHFTDDNGKILKFKSADPNTQSQKSGAIALLLAIFFGVLGIHRFYVGKIGTGLLMLITFGGLGIWALIDIIVIAFGNFTDKNEQSLSFSPDKNPSGKTVVAIIIGLFLALILFVAFTAASVFYATSGLADAARDQLAALRAHDFVKAYSYTSTEFQKATPIEKFEEFVNTYPVLKDNKDSTFFNRTIDINGTGVISGTLESTDGSTSPVVYQFVKENGVWKIMNIDLKPANAGVTVDKKNLPDEQGQQEPEQQAPQDQPEPQDQNKEE